VVKVIKLMASFDALIFFPGPNVSMMHSHLICVDTILKSMLPSAISVSSSSYPKDITWPSSTCTIAASTFYTTTATSVTFFYSMASRATSHISVT